jgi:hypothetical protein
MPILTFALSPDGLAVQVLLGLSRANAQALRAAGQAIPQPVQLRALIDTGADLTSVVDAAVGPLGLLPLGPFAVNTANGLTIVNRYAVSLTLLAPPGRPPQHLTRQNMPVIGMANAPIGFDAIVGMDLLRDCLLVVDGPAGQFTLAF